MDSEKGMPGGIATLDEHGKIPESQHPNKLVVTGVQQPGWYRIGRVNSKSLTVGTFTLTVQRKFNNVYPEEYKAIVNILATGGLSAGAPDYSIYVTQLAGRIVHQLVDKIRCVHDEINKSGLYFDLHYNSGSYNTVTALVDGESYDGVEGMSFDISPKLEIAPEIQQGQRATEFEIVPGGGLVADRAHSDGDGNNIQKTYQQKSGEIMCVGRDGYIAYPEGGHFDCTTDELTGFLKITLPINYSDTMLKFVVSIFNYRTGETTDYHISGYNFTGSRWVECTAICIGKAGKRKSNLIVRFGSKGDKCAITIGESDEPWSYVKVQIHEILTGQSYISFPIWKSGWVISVDQNPLDKVDVTITDTNVTHNEKLDNPVNRRNTFCDENLGSVFTDEQKAAIRNGTFKGMSVGNYWYINNVKWRIVDINYWLGTGDEVCTVPHLVIMPDKPLYNAKMNNSNTVVGGYVSSVMRKTNLEQAKTIVNEAFGEEYVLNHREYLMTDATNEGHPTGDWYDSTIELPNEIMMYGSYIYAAAGEENFIPHLYTIDKAQLALMKLYPAYMNLARNNLWLRDMVKGSYFCYLSYQGQAAYHAATGILGVRPVFGLIS